MEYHVLLSPAVLAMGLMEKKTYYLEERAALVKALLQDSLNQFPDPMVTIASKEPVQEMKPVAFMSALIRQVEVDVKAMPLAERTAAELAETQRVGMVVKAKDDLEKADAERTLQQVSWLQTK
jgi:hypothetical protein